MEHAQRVVGLAETVKEYAFSLNPYFNGTCSKRFNHLKVKTMEINCLNPYFNGTCSKR